MNRKQRRSAQSQALPTILWRNKSCSVEDAEALAIKEYGLGHFQAALDIIGLIIAKLPNRAEAYNSQAIILQAMKRYEEALASCDKAVALNSAFSLAYNTRGNIQVTLERYDDALESFDKTIALTPDYIFAHNNKGLALQNAMRYDDALASYDKAIALAPDYAEAYFNRGLTLEMLKRYDDALASYDKAITLNPNIPYLLGCWLHIRMHLCHWQGFDNIVKVLAAKIEADEPASPPFILVATPLSPALLQKNAQLHVKNKFPPSAAPLWRGEKYSHDRIRIGYFSADFYNHATSYLMAGLFERHDRSKFEIVSFSFGPPSSDAMRKRLENATECFIDVSGKSDREIAALARGMEIDIAFDLKGFTKHSRTGIFALRPAPVQINYLGYPGTMGASYMDYLIADATIIPEAYRRYYTEKIVCLPDSYQINDASRAVSEKQFSRADVGLPENGFVFCSFNNGYKITPDIFDIWMRLLRKVDGSVLWLFENNPTAAKNLRAEAEKRGISGHRLIFAPRMDIADHLARHRLADLFLDTFYCNAHTTASDALWEGLPLLTWQGETFAGRVAASLLNAMDLGEMIAHSHAEYEAFALELAAHPQKLSAVRQKLIQNRITRPLFDTALYTKRFEEACMKIWERSQAGLPPDHIHIQS